MKEKINKLKTWMGKKAATVSIALSNVEKSALNQTGELMSSDISQAQRLTQGQVLDSLINGEITQEVMDLRWRTYKVLQEADTKTTNITGYEADGTPITKTIQKDTKRGLIKIKVDKFDDYILEFVVPNDEITMSGNDVLFNKHIDFNKFSGSTIGEISSDEYFITQKSEKPLIINSINTRRFFIENLATKMNIRIISDETRLLEFYVSKYPDDYNRTSHLFIKELHKIINEGKKSDITDIDEVEFITYKAIGVDDFLEFKYEIISFDKIVEFNGSYVIKFIAKPIKNGENILLKYQQNELDLKYNNRVKK